MVVVGATVVVVTGAGALVVVEGTVVVGDVVVVLAGSVVVVEMDLRGLRFAYMPLEANALDPLDNVAVDNATNSGTVTGNVVANDVAIAPR
jgi:hypothetical protein